LKPQISSFKYQINNKFPSSIDNKDVGIKLIGALVIDHLNLFEFWELLFEIFKLAEAELESILYPVNS
jgi:hypothetical protein